MMIISSRRTLPAPIRRILPDNHAPLVRHPHAALVEALGADLLGRPGDLLVGVELFFGFGVLRSESETRELRVRFWFWSGSWCAPCVCVCVCVYR